MTSPLLSQRAFRPLLRADNSIGRCFKQQAQQCQQQLQQQQQRGLWQEVVRRRKDKNGKLKYEDPERVALRFQDARRGDGEALLDLHMWNERHEKPWMKKQRLIGKKRYEFDQKHVMNLAKYIQFVQNNKDKK